MSPGGSQASAGEGLSPCNIGNIGWICAHEQREYRIHLQPCLLASCAGCSRCIVQGGLQSLQAFEVRQLHK